LKISIKAIPSFFWFRPAPLFFLLLLEIKNSDLEIYKAKTVPLLKKTNDSGLYKMGTIYRHKFIIVMNLIGEKILYVGPFG
jgi:hypothetical protein